MRSQPFAVGRLCVPNFLEGAQISGGRPLFNILFVENAFYGAFPANAHCPNSVFRSLRLTLLGIVFDPFGYRSSNYNNPPKIASTAPGGRRSPGVRLACNDPSPAFKRSSSKPPLRSPLLKPVAVCDLTFRHLAALILAAIQAPLFTPTFPTSICICDLDSRR